MGLKTPQYKREINWKLTIKLKKNTNQTIGLSKK